MQDIVGRTVVARTNDGPRRGKVREVISRQEAEKKLGVRRPIRLRSGNYLIIQGVSYPIRRGRCTIEERHPAAPPKERPKPQKKRKPKAKKPDKPAAKKKQTKKDKAEVPTQRKRRRKKS